MISREETEMLLEAMRNSRPKKIFEHFDKDKTGIMCVLHYLFKANGAVTAGDISSHMKVSTARVAVLIKNMEGKKLIVKTTDPEDARKTLIIISDDGKKMLNDYKEGMLLFLSNVIERVGVDKFKEFIRLSNDVKDAMEAEASKYSAPQKNS